ADIRGAIAAGDGRRLRARPVRAHLRACAGCHELRESTRQRRRTMAALVPVWVAELAARIAGSAPVSAGEPGTLAAKTLVAAALGLTLGVGVARHQALEAGRAPGLTPTPPVATTPMPAARAATSSSHAPAPGGVVLQPGAAARAPIAVHVAPRTRRAAPVVPRAVSLHRAARPAP